MLTKYVFKWCQRIFTLWQAFFKMSLSISIFDNRFVENVNLVNFKSVVLDMKVNTVVTWSFESCVSFNTTVWSLHTARASVCPGTCDKLLPERLIVWSFRSWLFPIIAVSAIVCLTVRWVPFNTTLCSLHIAVARMSGSHSDKLFQEMSNDCKCRLAEVAILQTIQFSWIILRNLHVKQILAQPWSNDLVMECQTVFSNP